MNTLNTRFRSFQQLHGSGPHFASSKSLQKKGHTACRICSAFCPRPFCQKSAHWAMQRSWSACIYLLHHFAMPRLKSSTWHATSTLPWVQGAMESSAWQSLLHLLPFSITVRLFKRAASGALRILRQIGIHRFKNAKGKPQALLPRVWHCWRMEANGSSYSRGSKVGAKGLFDRFLPRGYLFCPGTQPKTHGVVSWAISQSEPICVNIWPSFLMVSAAPFALRSRAMATHHGQDHHVETR